MLWTLPKPWLERLGLSNAVPAPRFFAEGGRPGPQVSAIPLPSAAKTERLLDELTRKGSAEEREPTNTQAADKGPTTGVPWTTHIEQANHLVPFLQRMHALTHGDTSHVRIAMYSDSVNGSDRVSHALRQRLQRRFGAGGKGWVPIAPGWRFQRHQGVVWSSGGWSVRVVNRPGGTDGRFGYGGVWAQRRAPGAWAEYRFEGDNMPTRIRLFGAFSHQPGHPPPPVVARWQVDGGKAKRPVRSSAPISLTKPARTLRLTGVAHDTRFHGAVFETERGIVVDGLMWVGAFTRVLTHMDMEPWKRRLEERGADLVILWFGGNDATASQVPFQNEPYRAALRDVLSQLCVPTRPCLVLSALDAAQEGPRGLITRPRVPHIIRAQREVTADGGWSFLNLYQELGGKGTVARWARQRRGLVGPDHFHLTRRGAEVVGALIERELVAAHRDMTSHYTPTDPENRSASEVTLPDSVR